MGALSITHAFQGVEIVSIHRDDVVEVCEIRGPNLATARVEADPMLFRHEDRSGVGTLADMPGSGTRAVDLELIGQACFFHEMAEDALGERGAADVAEADKKNRRKSGRG